ncbi:Flagellar trans-acting factor FliX [Rhodovulum sp. PH10]|uniref:flagellar assembly protein FliX n=1 Tax=Rhodovulum sp. PH10 TaxID=1187851 RepID=UPI00027C2E6E|nr:flagellar assembly protein FliX [Rhodovulum sp. PH10]EJW09878.1 Flagellar trans-acting factor FliX [Rhodovulum sp. PH10]
MRITGPNGPAKTGTAAPASRRTGGGGGTFSLGDTTAPLQPAATSATQSLTGIEALLALQGVEDATERRKRAVGRGRSALDVLDEIKIALLAGDLDPRLLSRLQSVAASLKEPSGDPGLDGVLAEIELRVEVELAKLKPAGNT